MARARSFLREAVLPMTRLALPVVAAELGWMAMGVVDTLMVAPLGAAALGATGIGSVLVMAIGVFGMGLLLGLDTTVSQAHGAGDQESCDRWLVAGLWLALFATVPLALVMVATHLLLPSMGFHADVLPYVQRYFPIAGASLPFLLGYAALRRYLQALSQVRVIAFALVSANVVNVICNGLLINGLGPVPALGVQGAAWATLLSRLYMMGLLAWAVWSDHHRRGVAFVGWQLDGARLRRLRVLGLPAAAHLTFEVGVFTAVTALAGQLPPADLAAHQIALNIASVVFMIPLGISGAAAVLVGQHLGRRDVQGARRAGWAAIALVLCVMVLSATLFVTWPQGLVSLYTSESAVIAVGVRLLGVAAAFQLFDGLQVATTGALRGLGETRLPMLISLTGYWICGLPFAWWLCFRAGYGVIGLWMGLAVSLAFVGLALLWLWHWSIRDAARLRTPAAVSA